MEIVIVFAPLAIAVIEVVAAATSVGISLRTKVGPPNWDYSKSWATNVAILGAVLGTFLSSKLVSNPRFIEPTGYALLSVLFAVLVAIAPLCFRALSSETRVLTPSASGDIQYQGTVFGFLLATMLTLWGALGQLATLAALSMEMLISSGQYSATLALLASLVVGIVAVIWFAWSTFKPLLQHQADIAGHASQLVTQMRMAGQTPPQDFGPKDAPLPGWHLL